MSSFDGGNANVIRDFLSSFNAYSAHDYYYIFDCRRLNASFDFAAFDVVVIFWSVYLLGSELTEPVRDRISEARALKVLFLQDEYRNVRTMNTIMNRLGIQVMCTCVDEADHDVFYPKALIPSLRTTYTVLTGYVPAYLEQMRADFGAPRPVDIAYRSRVLPYWLGDLGQEKQLIADRFQVLAQENGLRSDISVREQDRLYGRRWVQFLASAKFALGSASGASVTDFTGEIRHNCEKYLFENPAASYDEVKRRFFADVDWQVVIDTVSPRVFEAVALGCTLVLHEGKYGGILRPDEHYICVARDYSNIRAVLDRMRDATFCRDLAARAHRDLIASGVYSYRAFARRFDALLAEHVDGISRQSRRSTVSFYAENYRRHHPRIIPAGGTFRKLPSKLLLQGTPQRLTRAAVALRLALGHRPLRRLVLRTVRSRSRSDMRTTAVLTDALRLAMLWQAQAGALTAWSVTPFGVSARLEANRGQLTFTTWPIGDGQLDPIANAPAPVVDIARAEAALRDGVVQSIVWDHSAVGNYVPFALGSKWLSIGLGDSGLYRFEALQRIAARHPESVAALLLPLLREEGHTPPGTGWARALLRLWIPPCTPGLAPLLLRYVVDWRARRSVGAAQLLDDLSRLVIVKQSRTGRLTTYAYWPFTVAARLDPASDALLLVSRETDAVRRANLEHDEELQSAVTAIEEGKLKSIVWDHSRLGVYVPYAARFLPLVRFGIGQRGLYSFDAFVTLARHFPREAATALRSLLLQR